MLFRTAKKAPSNVILISYCHGWDDREVNAVGLNHTPSSEERLTLTPAEFITKLGAGRDSVYAALRAGKIKSIRLGRRILIPKGELERILVEGLA